MESSTAPGSPIVQHTCGLQRIRVAQQSDTHFVTSNEYRENNIQQDRTRVALSLLHFSAFSKAEENPARLTLFMDIDPDSSYYRPRSFLCTVFE